MCRNIRTLFNFDPPATEEEIHAASVQFVRKLSGFTQPSKANETAFNTAVDDVADVIGKSGRRVPGRAPQNVSRNGRADKSLVDDASPRLRLFLLLPLPVFLQD